MSYFGTIYADTELDVYKRQAVCAFYRQPERVPHRGDLGGL